MFTCTDKSVIELPMFEQLLNSLNEEIFYEIEDGVNNFL